MSSYIEKGVTQALDVQAPRSDVRNALASPPNESISQNNKNDNDILKQDRNTDSEGNKLTKEQQEYFKDSKVRDEKGNLKVMYHQTGADFTVFNSNKEVAGKYDSELPTGYFLKTDSRDISVGGNKQMKVYANITNPLTFNNRDEAVHYWKKEIPEYASRHNTIKGDRQRIPKEI